MIGHRARWGLLAAPFILAAASCTAIAPASSSAHTAFTLSETPDSVWPLIEISLDVAPGDEGACHTTFDVDEAGQVDRDTIDYECDTIRLRREARRILSGLEFHPFMQGGQPARRAGVLADITFRSEDPEGLRGPVWLEPQGSPSKGNGYPNEFLFRQF